MFADCLAKARHHIRLASKEHAEHQHELQPQAERIDNLVIALHQMVHAMELLHLKYRPREPD
jgi:hypothetical protein